MDTVVVVGFGFGTDDEHIDCILRTIVNDDGKDHYRLIKYIFRIRNSFYKGAVALTLPLKYNKNAWMAWSILLCRYDPGCCF
ncbi:MAG: hypothetical protein VZR24_23715 [Butyrivibrio hungatei]|nr:hypothetical protein [Butyrivibrio hungatei]